MTRYYIDLKEYAETADISEVSNETLKEVIKDFLLEAQNRALTIPDVSNLLKAERESTKEEIREWLRGEDFEGLAERL